MKMYKKLFPDKKWWSTKIDFHLDKEFIEEIKSLEKVHYDEKKNLLMVNEAISEREKTDFLFLISLYKHEDQFLPILNELESRLNRKNEPTASNIYRLSGKGVFGGPISFTPRFWLKWNARYSYHIIDSFSGLIDRPMYYQLVTNRRIQLEIIKYVLEVGDINSVSWFYDQIALASKDRKMPVEPLPSVNFDYILTKVIKFWSCSNPILAEEKELFHPESGHIYWNGIDIRFITAVSYGPIDKPYLGLWKLKNDSKTGIITKSHLPILNKIDEIKDKQLESLAKFYKKRGYVIKSDIPETTQTQVAQLGSSADKKEKEVKNFVVYLPTSTGIGATISEISKKKVNEKYLQKNNDYSIFIYTRRIFVRIGKELKPLIMDERIYRLLVIFLRQKDMLIPPIPLYRKAWAAAPLKITNINDERDISPYLKTAISQLRFILKDVPGFEITKARFQGYICSGKFRFCVIIPKAEERQYILSEAEEQEADFPSQ